MFHSLLMRTVRPRSFFNPPYSVVARNRTMIGTNQARRTALSTVSINHNLSSTPKSGKVVILEGNIGAGKTTLACQLARQLNCRLFLEPTTKNPYLAKFYQDPNKYALKLQLWIFKQRFRTFIEATKHALETGE